MSASAAPERPKRRRRKAQGAGSSTTAPRDAQVLELRNLVQAQIRAEDALDAADNDEAEEKWQAMWGANLEDLQRATDSLAHRPPPSTPSALQLDTNQRIMVRDLDDLIRTARDNGGQCDQSELLNKVKNVVEAFKEHPRISVKDAPAWKPRNCRTRDRDDPDYDSGPELEDEEVLITDEEMPDIASEHFNSRVD